MSAKKTILVLCDWFLPGYLAGGPIQSVATLTEQLGNDVHFKIITTDRDFKSDKAYSEVPADQWTNFKGREVFYLSPKNMNPAFLLNLIQKTSHDVIYLNSLFSKLLTIYPLKWNQQGKFNSQLILAPRGMLRDGALAVKPIKKQLFLRYAKLFGLFSGIHWQSTSSDESKEIKKRIGSKVLITEAPNFPAVTSSIKPIEKKKGELKLCFVARILGIKNLIFAIDVLRELKVQSIVFDVYGPQEDLEYWTLCKENAKQLPSNISFNYKGVLRSEDVGETMDQYHALFLPTQTENFGHVIVQSLSRGRPVIISDNTPWRDLEKERAGFDVSLNEQKTFVTAVQKLAELDQTGYNEMSQGATSYMKKKLDIEQIKTKYLQMFNAI